MPVLSRRASGILVHPTSLPGRGIGTIGRMTYGLVDWLAEAGQSVWQILPLVAVDAGGSPYNGLSAMAGNALLLDLDGLVEAGLLDAGDLAGAPPEEGRIDFSSLADWKGELIGRAYRAFHESGESPMRAELARYREAHRGWIEDYALFRALRAANGGEDWTRWPAPLRGREPDALLRAREELADDMERQCLLQMLFDRQWSAVRSYAAERGVRVVGDIPIFVAHDSADVWAHQELFELDERGRATAVSGVPPDYFSETGQRWGNPLYRWDVMRDDGYRWWVERFRRTLQWVDVVRVDHFRGFEAYWEIPAEAETARTGEWRPGPGADLFHALGERLGQLPVIAEDLGLITKAVEALRDELGFPGMRVLEFAFDGDPDNPHLPENYPVHVAAYTGTHDNDTVLGWWSETTPAQREEVLRRARDRDAPIHWRLIRMVLESRASLAVVPIQDVLGLGSEARMNTPGTTTANWSWRLASGSLTPELAARLRELTEETGRLPGAAHDAPSHTEGGR